MGGGILITKIFVFRLRQERILQIQDLQSLLKTGLLQKKSMMFF